MSNKKKSLKSILLEDCSFNRGSMRFVPPGGEMLRYIDCDVFHVRFTREDKDSPWNIKQRMVRIVNISDWEPLSGTYKVTYTENFSDMETMRMIPEGFRFENTEETNEMERFVPASIHFTLLELDSFYNRLGELFTKTPTLPIDSIKKIQESNQEEQLGYYHNVGFLLKNPEVGICYFRIKKITVPVKMGKEWKFSVIDSDGNVFPVKMTDKETQTFYLNGENLGEFKIIDIIQ